MKKVLTTHFASTFAHTPQGSYYSSNQFSKSLTKPRPAAQVIDALNYLGPAALERPQLFPAALWDSSL
jgi:hypothetical protein